MQLKTRNAFKKQVYRGAPLAEPPSPELTAILDRHRGHPDALITVLEEIQHHYGYLPRQQLEYTAHELGFPLSRIYGVVTFYNLFQLKPPGRYQVRVCKGTACHVGKSGAILEHIKEHLGIDEDETTPDKLFTLQTVACVGACSLAPVVVVNERTHAKMTPEKTWEALQHLHEEVS
jgi:NADH:ubiquinone oxidoreductase subunit E